MQQDTIVNTTKTGIQTTPVIAPLSSGGWVVIWASDAHSGDVLGQVFDASGARSGSEFVVSTTTTASQNAPAVAALPDGGFIVAWQDGRSDQGDIYAQRFSATGARVGSETSVATATTGVQLNPDISVAHDGSYLISWTTAAATSGDVDHAWIARYDAAGNKLGADIDATSFSSGTDDWVALSAGHYAVGYVSGSDVRARFVDIAGTSVTVGTSFLLNDPTLQYGNPASLSIVPLADGSIAAAWITGQYSSGFYSTYGVGSRTFNSSGARGTTVTDVTSTSTYTDISIAPLFDGYVVSWGGDVGSANHVSYARTFDYSGDAIGGRFQVNVTAGAGAAHIAGLASGSFVAAFAADEIRMRSFDAPTRLFGDAGDDHLTAVSESTPTQIDGFDGADTLTGGLLADELHGGNGADTINGGSGDDIISGDAGSDTLAGGSGNDTIYAAQPGLETLYVPNFVSGFDRGTEIDTLSGGDGDDLLFAGVRDNVDGGAGVDTLYLSARNASAGIRIDLSTTAAQTGAGGTIAGVEVAGLIEGSDFADTIVAGPLTAPSYSFSGYLGSIYGFGGDDQLTGGFFTPNVYGGDGNDTLKAADSNSTLIGGAGADTITGGGGNDLLSSADGNSDPIFFYSTSFPITLPVFDHGSEIDTLSGGAGDDTIMVGYGDSANGGANSSRGDKLVISLIGATTGVVADFSQATLTFGGGTITGMEGVDWVEGSNFGDAISFGPAQFAPAAGTQNVIAAGGNDTVTAGYYTQYIDGGDGDDTLDGRGSQYLSFISGGTGNDTLYGSATATLSGGDGNDKIYAASGAIYGDGGDDLIVLSTSSYPTNVYGGDGADEIRAAASGGNFYGDAGADYLIGGTGADNLYAAGATTTNGAVAPADDMGSEHDRISGGDGNDQIGIGYGDDADGGAGSDTLLLSLGGASAGVTLDTATLVGTVPISLGGGTIQSFEIVGSVRGTEFDDAITAAAQAVAITVNGGGGDDVITGSRFNDTLLGGAGNDTLDGGAGNDRMTGGTGNDIYFVDSSADVVIESANQGTDEIRTKLASFTLGANVENLTGLLTTGQTLNGNTLANVLTGSSGNDVLDGKAGADTMIGGLGNDVYYVDNEDDTVIEQAGAGTDEVRTTAGSYTLSDNIETLTGLATTNQNLFGNSGDNVITGGIGNDYLRGGDGNDTLSGGAGNDVIDPGLGVDRVDGGAGDDVIEFFITEFSTPTSLFGSIAGGAGNDLLDLRYVTATLGSMTDGTNYFLGVYVGSQKYSISGVETIQLGERNDSVFLPASTDPVQIRTGDGDDYVASNTVARIYGEDGNDTIFIGGLYGSSAKGLADGGAGFDTLVTNISFTVDLAAGTAIAGGASYTIASFEAVQVSAVSGYRSSVSGSDAAENFSVKPTDNDGSVGVFFDGRGGDDILSGSKGADYLYGGLGNDTFYVDRQDDLVFEKANEGTDSVISTGNFYLYANIENLTLAAGAGNIFGVGNELANTITGNEGANTLLAGAGADVVNAGAGVDIVYGQAGDDQLFGEADNDFLAGGDGDDVIDGGAGGDSAYGEGGNDILYGGATFAFDILVGGDGNDVLHGDSGLGDYDYLYGNAGDDSFYVDTGDDLTFEQANQGTDTVYANVAGANNGVYLYANIENLILLGTTTFGVGNELNNTMTGNASSNYLLGGAGDDVLNGKAGNDVLFGESGADTFVFEHGTGGDVIGDFTVGTDRIDLSAIGYSWEQVLNSLHENGGNTAIDLGGGDLVVLNGVTAAQLHASDFILAGAGAATTTLGAQRFQLDGGNATPTLHALGGAVADVADSTPFAGPWFDHRAGENAVFDMRWHDAATLPIDTVTVVLA